MTAAARHLVTSRLFDEFVIALLAGTDESLGHGFL